MMLDESARRVQEKLESRFGQKIKDIQDITENDIDPIQFLQFPCVLKQMQSLRTIQFSYPRLGELNNSSYKLAAGDGHPEADLSNLSLVPHLQTLTLSGCKLTTARFLSKLPRLKRAYLNNNLIYDLGDLASDCERVVLQLLRLDLSNNTLPDNKALALDRLSKALPHLESLNLIGCPLLTLKSSAPAIEEIGTFVATWCPNLEVFCERSFRHTHHPATSPPPNPHSSSKDRHSPAPKSLNTSSTPTAHNRLKDIENAARPITHHYAVSQDPINHGCVIGKSSTLSSSDLSRTKPKNLDLTPDGRQLPFQRITPPVNVGPPPPRTPATSTNQSSPSCNTLRDTSQRPAVVERSQTTTVNTSSSIGHFFTFNAPDTPPSVSTLPDAPSLAAYAHRTPAQQTTASYFFNTHQTPQVEDFQPRVTLDALGSIEESPSGLMESNDASCAPAPPVYEPLWPSPRSHETDPSKRVNRHIEKIVEAEAVEEPIEVDHPVRKTTDIRNELAGEDTVRNTGAFQSLMQTTASSRALSSHTIEQEFKGGRRESELERYRDDVMPSESLSFGRRSADDDDRRRHESIRVNRPRPAPGTADLSHLRSELEKWKEESLKPYRDVLPTPPQQRHNTVAMIMESRGARIPPSTSSGAGILQTPQTPVMFGTTMDLNTTVSSSPNCRKPFDSGGSPTSVSTASTSVGFSRRPNTTDSFPDLARLRRSTFEHGTVDMRTGGGYDAAGEPSHRSPGTLRNLRLPDTTDETRFHPRR